MRELRTVSILLVGTVVPKPSANGSRTFLCPVTPRPQIISYYYNIWKIRYTPAAAQWHVERRLQKPPSDMEDEDV